MACDTAVQISDSPLSVSRSAYLARLKVKYRSRCRALSEKLRSARFRRKKGSMDRIVHGALLPAITWNGV